MGLVRSEAQTVDEYIESLPEDRREAIAAVRAAVLAHLPDGYEEGMQYGMIGWYIPLEDYPDTYNGEPLAIAALASQKRHMSLYLNCVYSDEGEKRRFEERWAETGKKLDMGKSCVRFKELDDLPLDVVGEAVARVTPEDFIESYERARGIR
jgi:Domain of unknown function (DU1801)